MICPKCGFEQNDGPECLSCGLIFMRYHGIGLNSAPRPEPTPGAAKSPIGRFRRIYRALRLISPIVLITAILLILRPSKPPAIDIRPEAAQQAEAKIIEFQAQANRGAEQRLEMDESELNAWMQKNLALKKPVLPASEPDPASADLRVSPDETQTPSESPGNVALERAQSSVRDVRIQLLEDSVRIHAAFDVHGVNLTLQLDGRLTVQDGYLRMEPTSGRLGSFPLLAGTLQSAVSRLFDSPENREKFRLPPHIRDIRIDHGQLILISN